MANQKKIDDLHQRVSAWSEKLHEESKGWEEVADDPDFNALVGELMEQDMDTLMVLLGKAMSETSDNKTFNILGDVLDKD